MDPLIIRRRPPLPGGFNAVDLIWVGLFVRPSSWRAHVSEIWPVDGRGWVRS